MRLRLPLLFTLLITLLSLNTHAQIYTATHVVTYQPLSPCAGSPVQFRATDISGSLAGMNITWDMGDGTDVLVVPSGSTFHYLYRDPGHYRISYDIGGADAGNFILEVGEPCGENDLITGRVFVDTDGNGAMGDTESPMSGQIVTSSAVDEGVVVSTDEAGDYGFYFPAGQFTTELRPVPNHDITAPASGSNPVGSSGTGAVSEGHDFGVKPVPNIQDLKIDIDAALPIPGQTRTYHITYKNVGSIMMSGNIDFKFDPLLVYTGASNAHTYAGGNNIIWPYTNLMPGEIRHVIAWLYVDPSIPIGTWLHHTATIHPVPGDATPWDNTYNISEEVVNGFDPNDKLVSPAGEGPDGNVAPGTDFTYTIRFQNTGTYYARDIVVRDHLDSELDQTSLEILSSSHPMNWTLNQGELVFSFPNIMLPDSNMNEPASHGFIRYSISPKPNAPIGTRIENTAAIYFDFNPAVITNTTVNTLSLSVATEPSHAGQELSIVPHPVGQSATVLFENPLGLSHSFNLLDLSGKEISRIEGIGGESFVFDRKGLPAGIYLYRLCDGQGRQVSAGRLVVQ